MSPTEKLEDFFSAAKPLFFKKGEIVLRISDIPAGAYYLKKGYIKDSAMSQEGEEFTLFIFKPGDLFPYSWIFNNVPHNHSFRAMTDCIVYQRTKESLMQELKKDSELLFLINQRVLVRLRGVLQRLEYFAFGNAPKKSCIYI